jgi:poly(3-hydroxybutyrate) depolymerase
LKTLLHMFLLSLVSSGLFAQTITRNTVLWNGVTRFYTVVQPPANIVRSGELVITLHGNKYAISTAPPDNNYYGWDYQCKQKGNGCILVAAVSSSDPDSTTKGDTKGYWVWNAQFFDDMVFSAPPPYPDDIGYLRQLISIVVAQYNIDPRKIYVVGYSTGALMAARVAVEMSDVVAAVSINSGSLQSTIGTKTVPNITAPVSITQYHGTLDTNLSGLDPCSGKWDWNKALPEDSTVDQTYDYFVAQNGCAVQQSILPLCQIINGTKVFNNNDATSCMGNNEVKFTWEVGTAHRYVTSHNAADYLFFREHPKP